MMKNKYPKEFKVYKDRIRLVAFIVILAILYVMFKVVFETNYVPSGSMEPTLMTNDMVMVERYKSNMEIKRGDIVTFRYPDNKSELFVKRVIGLPGEQIEIKKGRVYVNGKLLDESSYLKVTPNSNGDGVYYVPENSYFMLGDNRNHSHDSRFWTNKYVKEDDIEGKPIFRIAPLNTIGSLTQKNIYK